MKNVRIWFQKVNTARYISHLDLAGCMGRVLKISRLPVWYTEGFNPRVYMTFAMPLSLGIDGLRECMDIRLKEELLPQEVMDRLNAHLPADLKVLEVREPEMKFEEIQFAGYEIQLEENQPFPSLWEATLAQPEILVRKHTKKGERTVDMKPSFSSLQLKSQGEGAYSLSGVLPCSVAGSVNPFLLLTALEEKAGRDLTAHVSRTALLTKDLTNFL